MGKSNLGFACKDCGTRFESNPIRCTECFGYRVRKRKPPIVEYDKEVKLGDVKRITSRLEWWDSFLNGGLYKGAVAMLAGSPGTGKSTLVHQAYGGPKTLWLVNEESPVASAARRDRLGFSGGVVVRSVDAISERMLRQFTVLVVDSLQGFGGNWDSQALVHDKLLKMVLRTGITAVLISQVSNAGEAAGGKRVSHRPDINLVAKRADDTVTFKLDKNRFGDSDTVSRPYVGGVFQ